MSRDASAPNDLRWQHPQQLARGLDWLTAHQQGILVLGVAFQMILLAAMMVRPLITLATGETILLRVVPVDPRDIFRGDYVTLSYEISRPGWNNSESWESNWARAEQMNLREGETIYVVLEPEADGKHWRFSKYQYEAPSEGMFIRGTVTGGGFVRYGIEQYFVQEGQGLVYEEAVRKRNLSAEIALDGNGSAQIKRLIIE